MRLVCGTRGIGTLFEDGEAVAFAERTDISEMRRLVWPVSGRNGGYEKATEEECAEQQEEERRKPIHHSTGA